MAAPGASRSSTGVEGEPVPMPVENMTSRALQYLTETQSDAGTWPDARYGEKPGVIALAVLAFLSRGENPQTGQYADPIQRGLDYILKSQNKKNGYIGPQMYDHAFATLTLAEAYGRVGDKRLGSALVDAVELILSAQKRNPHNAWRYNPDSTDADTTVSGACLMALFAARNAGLPVPQKTIDKGLAFYKTCQTSEGGFGYTAARDPNPARAAVGTLMFLLAEKRDSPVFKKAYRYLKDRGYGGDSYPYYYRYYAAQAYFHADPEAWEEWNKTNISRLQQLQDTEGSWTGRHGKVFCTAAAVLSLAVNYRFLPIYER